MSVSEPGILLMKTFVLFIAVMSFHPILWAQTKSTDSVRFTIIFKNKRVQIDSAYVIFDRCDLTGAGVVKRVFYPADNRIVIDKVPQGKYFIDIFPIGTTRQNISKVSVVAKKKSNTLQVPLTFCDTYVPGTAIIPDSNVDLENLLVTRKKLY